MWHSASSTAATEEVEGDEEGRDGDGFVGKLKVQFG